MPRSFTYSALALRVKPSGESNREAWFLCAEAGLIRATVFGGAKSRLRSQVAPFHEGKLLVYHEPVKDSRKVTDFDVQSWRPGIRELWERAMTAGALAETILSSQGGGGNWPEALKLAASVLDTLNEANAEACLSLAVYFLWNWAKILGIRPDLYHCASCFCEVNCNDTKEILWYSGRKEAFFCEKCRGEPSVQIRAPGPDSLLRISPESRLWLTEIARIPPSALEELPLDAISLEQAKLLSQAVLAGAIGKRLATWDEI